MTIDTTHRATQICAVIVTYNNAASLECCLNSVKDQVGAIVVVDNSSDTVASDHIQRICAACTPPMQYILNPENNLGRAQNMAIAWAKSNGFLWVLLLDDDSVAKPDMVSNMLSAYQSHPAQETLGIIAPYLNDSNVNEAPFYYTVNRVGIYVRTRFSKTSKSIENVMYVCASGSLIPMHVMNRVGMMNEAFFMYFIDTEFCLRVQASGYLILAVKDAVLDHEIGKRTHQSIAGINLTTTNHSPHSRYLMARNRIWMWKQFALSQPSYVAFDTLRTGYEMFRIACFESDKMNKFIAIAKGFKDGLLKKSKQKHG